MPPTTEPPLWVLLSLPPPIAILVVAANVGATLVATNGLKKVASLAEDQIEVEEDEMVQAEEPVADMKLDAVRSRRAVRSRGADPDITDANHLIEAVEDAEFGADWNSSGDDVNKVHLRIEGLQSAEDGIYDSEDSRIKRC
ncbi:hypothetical protein J5N97_025293 [Dioscorea zingiberensis]|uniref:Uncharacterized protein n=1 Tax=Dioscorea zingiberensis TaxID=325984 RepID=A0A9D5C898_9LILI|nr:hypothetical protein J5N97_025293 [Dioscorea zingiberensis]